VSIDPNTPVLIGLAQLIQRADDPAPKLDPLGMLERVARDAATECGAGDRALAALDTIGIVDVAGWSPHNAPRLLADRLGVRVEHEIVTLLGGEGPLSLLNSVAERILAGEARLACLAGANALDSLMSARKRGDWLDWAKGGDGEPEHLGSPKRGTSEREERYGITAPTNVYPLIENALRARRGRSVSEHQAALGRLMAPMTERAAENPFAWFPVRRSADEIATPSDANRMIAFPYPKYMNAVLFTDQAAGVLVASEQMADELGVPRAKRVYWWGGATTYERSWFVSEREDLSSATGMHECARRTFANAGVGVDEIRHIDFYSCFPVAVEAACEAYGVAEDDPRGLCVTGGLPYAGGPANNYTLHALIGVAERCRAHTGEKGLVTGNGWYLTKHSASVICSQPRSGEAPRAHWPEGPVAGAKPVEVVDEAQGAARVLTYTVVYDRSGQPQRGVVIGELLGDGGRFIAALPKDAAGLDAFTRVEGVGRLGRVSHSDGLNVFRPD
jgi:acetyl-CoA C-acetyltransferase